MSENVIIPIYASWQQVICWWSRQPWSPNPLLRTSDRFEALLRLVAVLAVVVAVPVAGALGTAAYTESAAQIRAENATKHSVIAVLIEESAKSAVHEFQANVRWDDNGRPGTAVVPVRRGLQAGDHVTVWLGPDGAPTTELRPTTAAAMTGIGVGVVTFVGTWFTSWCLVRGTGWLLDARRNARWAHEWRQLGRPIREDRQ
ncbi:Rv1733c family protein [Nocardia sp. CA-128927]|uniref:Rv1733c family protein n=1 Tax=Nocardia sp. CA-128927 TaxID=3239975 RepID=UPI003D97C3C5